MTAFSRSLSVLTVLALMSAPVLRAQDDQPYDPPQPQASEPLPDQAAPPSYDQVPAPQSDEPMSEQPPAAQQPQYDQAPPPSDRGYDQPYDQNNPQYNAENNAPSNRPDAPARAARLQYLSGSVSLQPQGTGDWVTGELNRPLTNGDNIWADKNSRAEISVGTGVIRIDSETSLTTTNIGQNVVQLQLHQGAMYLHVRRLYDGETYEVDTPNQAFTVQKPGDYRFDVDSDGDKTVITVWRGAGEATGDGQPVHLESNQQARFYEGTSLRHDIHAAPAADAFDQWAYSRDQRFDHSESAKYVSPDAVGYEDLDEYGTWKNTGEYGEVWAPNVGPDWAPYYNGHWVWEYPWGWTWVEYEPWGFAPFHYGRWVWAGGYWGWAPGPVWERPYYAPALVAWFGGPGWGLSFGFGFGGGFGWCPLGFGEPFIPWYHAGFGYFNRVNITNTRITNVNITNVYNNTFINGRPRPGGGVGGYGYANGHQYANLHAPHAFTAASRDALVNSRSIAHNGVRVSPSQLSRTSLTPVHNLGIRPTRTAMLGGASAGHGAPARAFSHPVVSHMSPPAVSRGGMGGSRVGGFAGRNTGTAGRGNFGGNAGVANRGTVGRPGTNMQTRGPIAGINRGAGSFPHPPNTGLSGKARTGAMGRGSISGERPSLGTCSMGPGVGRSVAPGIGCTMGPGTGPRGIGPRTTGPGMASRSVPRPSSGGMPRGGAPATGAPHGGAPGGGAPHSSGPHSQMSVPRPYGSTAPQGYSSAANRAPYASNRGMGSYGGNNRATPYGGSNGRTPSYGNAYGRSSYGQLPYGQLPAARSMPSYGGASSRAPHDSYARNFGGGRSPSFSGGSFGGGRAFSGGGRSSGNFGGGRSFGGGAHSSGGGGRSFSGDGGHTSGGGHSGGGHGLH